MTAIRWLSSFLLVRPEARSNDNVAAKIPRLYPYTEDSSTYILKASATKIPRLREQQTAAPKFWRSAKRQLSRREGSFPAAGSNGLGTCKGLRAKPREKNKDPSVDRRP